MKSLWVKSIWVKNMGENRGRWDAGFRSPLLRYIYNYIYLYIYIRPYIFFTVKMVEDYSSIAGVFCQRCAPNTVKR